MQVFWGAVILGLCIGFAFGIARGVKSVDQRVQELEQQRKVLELEAAVCKMESEEGCVCQQDATSSYRRQVVGKWTL